jgi:hypothetical protein
MPWKPWLSRFKKFLTVLGAVLIAILVTSGWIPTLAVARTGRYILSFFGIMSLGGATFNGGIAFAFWVDRRFGGDRERRETPRS